MFHGFSCTVQCWHTDIYVFQDLKEPQKLFTGQGRKEKLRSLMPYQQEQGSFSWKKINLVLKLSFSVCNRLDILL